MRELFAKECEVPLSKMNIGLVLRSMLEILRQNGMSIEGHFAALLTNMIVLEGLVKELDPEVNIVAKAASFLLHLRTIDKTIDEII
jgi:aarF domain-containing kinase